jgi:Transglutaminase-like superfamily
VTLLRPLPRRLTRTASLVVVGLWLVQMGVLLKRSVLDAAPVTLAADLARYGSAAHWRGIYYRGEKIGFSVSEIVPEAGGYELREDGQLQISLMGATTAARTRTRVEVDRAFDMRSFSFSLDPGTGPVEVDGRLQGLELELTIKSRSGERHETRRLSEPPQLALNLSRRLAAFGLETGRSFTVPVFDPATLRNAPMTVTVLAREVVSVEGKPTPAFKVHMAFSGITSTSWVTDVGEVVREESPMGLIVARESRERATAFAMPRDIQVDMYDAAAIVPEHGRKIDDPLSVDRLRVRLTGASLPEGDLEGAGQSVSGDVFELRDPELLPDQPADADLDRYLKPEPLIESDAPEIVAEAKKALSGIKGERARAERLVRHVNALLEKKPTVGLPDALEVLRTRVGDCNEHTALYVALARAAGIPARVAVGLVSLRGVFYYHAWAEVFLASAPGRGRWIPVDPTLDEFPADLTHLRLARGGLDRQAAILGVMGHASLDILDVVNRPGTREILVGRPAQEQARPLDIPIPKHDGSGRGCWSRPS